MNGWRSREIRSFRHAFAGIYEALRSERHMQFHLGAALLVIALAAWLRLSAGDWLWLLAAITGVWVAELINTAIERTVDRISSEQHPLAKAAKDTAAGAVLIAALFAVGVGLIVLGPPLWKACFQ
ncbi:diacylglycerol kinase family protein [Cohnella herbarum]|uniref:Diacylglycerol kinase family protein n=1 Tax=Cohnella herbarum TaxID=2728023 RepID=A0A7Z2VIJ6_9BACL|nr:diacylglycerol kinase family protein [Cohnella herbarum]QJD83641.1 diacylglycerol kinase family protein [Cohnella herbarum]